MPLRAKPFAPHCAMPTPCPQPWPVTTKTGSPVRGFVAARLASVRCSHGETGYEKAADDPCCQDECARHGVRDPIVPDDNRLEASASFWRKAVSLHGFHGMSLPVAVRIDILPTRYTEVRHIGRGGMGDVYRATDTTLGRTVAVKVLAERYADAEDVKRRFKNEALAAARLSGAPYTVTIFDVGEANGQAFIVMEYLEGGSLEQQLRAGKRDTADVIRWLEQAAVALDAGHAAGVV